MLLFWHAQKLIIKWKGIWPIWTEQPVKTLRANYKILLIKIFPSLLLRWKWWMRKTCLHVISCLASMVSYPSLWGPADGIPFLTRFQLSNTFLVCDQSHLFSPFYRFVHKSLHSLRGENNSKGSSWQLWSFIKRFWKLIRAQKSSDEYVHEWGWGNNGEKPIWSAVNTTLSTFVFTISHLYMLCYQRCSEESWLVIFAMIISLFFFFSSIAAHNFFSRTFESVIALQL